MFDRLAELAASSRSWSRSRPTCSRPVTSRPRSRPAAASPSSRRSSRCTASTRGRRRARRGARDGRRRDRPGDEGVPAARDRGQGARREELEARLKELLVPKDPNDGKNVIVEIRGAEGGDEANIWAGDLYRMYEQWSERHRWKTEVLSSQPSDMGGFRDVTFVVRGKDAWSHLKHEARPAPGAAGAGDREPGPGAHERGDGRGAARGRGGRRAGRPQRPRHRHVPLHRSGRAVGEHHRLRDPDHAQADRPRRHLPGREEPAPEQGQGDADPALAAAPGRAGAPGRRARRHAAQPGRRRRALGEDPHVQLQGEPGHRPPHRADPAQPRRACSRAISTRSPRSSWPRSAVASSRTASR